MSVLEPCLPGAGRPGAASEWAELVPAVPGEWFLRPESAGGIHGIGHTRRVGVHVLRLCVALDVPEPARDLALAAARWHDLGKAHAAFQKMLSGDDPARVGRLWAKSANPGGGCERRFFRHELASALAWLQTAPLDAPERDLVAYLIAAHHGKVRLSIRSLPGEEPPPDRAEARLARGVLDGDPLGPLEIEGVILPRVALDLSLMEMGWDAAGEPQRGPSWLARMIALRDRADLGPFRLAHLETLLRAADARASARIPNGPTVPYDDAP